MKLRVAGLFGVDCSFTCAADYVISVEKSNAGRTSGEHIGKSEPELMTG